MAPPRDTRLRPESYDQWGGPEPRNTEGKARQFTIAGFVMGAVGIFYFPIIFGGMGVTWGLMGNGRGDPLGKVAAGFSGAALVTGLVLAALFGTFPEGLVIGRPGMNAPEEITAADSLLSELQEGDCFDDGRHLEALVAGNPQDTFVLDVADARCTGAHDFELYLVQTLPGGQDAAFPGLDALNRRMNRICLASFDTYVGTHLDESGLSIWYFFPTAELWTVGNRRVGCAVFASDGSKLTESMQGSGR